MKKLQIIKTTVAKLNATTNGQNLGGKTTMTGPITGMGTRANKLWT